MGHFCLPRRWLRIVKLASDGTSVCSTAWPGWHRLLGRAQWRKGTCMSTHRVTAKVGGRGGGWIMASGNNICHSETWSPAPARSAAMLEGCEWKNRGRRLFTGTVDPTPAALLSFPSQPTLRSAGAATVSMPPATSQRVGTCATWKATPTCRRCRTSKRPVMHLRRELVLQVLGPARATTRVQPRHIARKSRFLSAGA
jgi:hypothetical protein